MWWEGNDSQIIHRVCYCFRGVCGGWGMTLRSYIGCVTALGVYVVGGE